MSDMVFPFATSRCWRFYRCLNCAFGLLIAMLWGAHSLQAESPPPVFNRAPLAEATYAELPLGAIQPQAWVRDELQRMAAGMTGNLDEWYPEVCGPRNAWLGGDGDTWERGPYWIDGLYPLAKILHDPALEAKAQRWIEATLASQRPDGFFGPRETMPKDRKAPPPPSAQIEQSDDWWPRMVMLKVLQQHYLATGDPRVIEFLTRYFRYQLRTLPSAPLQAQNGGPGGSWWAAQRGGDNLLVVLWLYNITGDAWLLELAKVLAEQTVPVTSWFLRGSKVAMRGDQGDALHCVNFAQMMKTPLVQFQVDQNPRHQQATRRGLETIRRFHGQPTGLYGGDEALHGDSPERGSELCSAVEMLFSLETMLRISGNVDYADRIERIAFNALPTQTTDDHTGRQYFQQPNQVQVTLGDHDFFNDEEDRLVYGLLQGYPCCTCNLHQGWPKFVQHLWLASADKGLAALVFAPSKMTATVGDKHEVTIEETTNYPFAESVNFQVICDDPVDFPLHLRIPKWCAGATIAINGEPSKMVCRAGSIVKVKRKWNSNDRVLLNLPMRLSTSRWFARSAVVERGPLIFALRIEEEWKEVAGERPPDVPATAPHRGYRECRPASPWNYALPKQVVDDPNLHLRIELEGEVALNPWTLDSTPLKLKTSARRLPEWTLQRNSAAPPPLSPIAAKRAALPMEITLVPYGATTLRITEFPWIAAE